MFYFTISATKGAGLLGKTDWSDEEDEEESADQPAKPEAPEESQVQDEQTPVEPGVENENAEQAPVAEEAPVQQGRLSGLFNRSNRRLLMNLNFRIDRKLRGAVRTSR